MENKLRQYFPQELSGISEQIRQDEAGRLWFDTVDPEIGTAGMILVSSIRQLEAVRFRVEGLPGRNTHGGPVRLPPHLGTDQQPAQTPLQLTEAEAKLAHTQKLSRWPQEFKRESFSPLIKGIKISLLLNPVSAKGGQIVPRKGRQRLWGSAGVLTLDKNSHGLGIILISL